MVKAQNQRVLEFCFAAPGFAYVSLLGLGEISFMLSSGVQVASAWAGGGDFQWSLCFFFGAFPLTLCFPQ